MEYKINKEINGEQLVKELLAAGIAYDINQKPVILEDTLFLRVLEADETKTKKILDNHLAENWTIKKDAARQAVLDKLGLSADEVAALLG